MCAELGWEVHYINLNGATDIEDLMGRFIPNPRKQNPGDPEFIFAPGKVTTGLKQENGKRKVIILDEYNSASPSIVIRLHEILDALERNGDVVLSEEGSEVISTSKEKTKIIALTNPPGKGYIGREPLDPAQLRRWIYKKEPSQLPEESFMTATDVLFNLTSMVTSVRARIANLPPEPLTLAELGGIDGMEEILSKYKEFHKAARGMLRNRAIAADQPQAFSYDDRMEPRRVRDFILHFYMGDINEAFAQALEYHYMDKLESNEDKAKIRELARHVVTTSGRKSNRRGLDGKSQATVRRMPEGLEAQIMEAKKIMGADFIGPDEISDAFGINIPTEQIPKIPFSIDDLERAKKAGQFLVFRVGRDSEGRNVDMEYLQRALKDKGIRMLKEGASWIKDTELYKSSVLSSGWALTAREPIKDSFGKSYQQQTGVLIRHLKREVYGGKPLPTQYAGAVEEYQNADKTLPSRDRRRQAIELSQLSITGFVRPTLLELVHDLYAYQLTRSEPLLSKHWAWTSNYIDDSSSGERHFVSVGPNDGGGLGISNKRHCNATHGALGAIFSRTF